MLSHLLIGTSPLILITNYLRHNLAWRDLWRRSDTRRQCTYTSMTCWWSWGLHFLLPGVLVEVLNRMR